MLNKKPIEKTYYSIREVSELVGLPLSTLRFWEKEFPQLSPKKNEHRTRFYTIQDIELIRKIKYMRDDQKMTIPAICLALQNNSEETDIHMSIVRNLMSIRDELEELRNLM